MSDRAGRSALQHFAPDIWLADGPGVRFLGVSLPTRMVIVKLGDGSVWINSPLAVSENLLQEIRAIGPVRYLIAPTKLHVWRLDQARALFPLAQMWAPPGASQLSGHLRFTGVLDDTPPPAWANELDQFIFRGNAFIEEAWFLHKKSRTAIGADFIQNYPANDGELFMNALKRFGGVLDGGVPLDIRLSFAANKPLARRSLEKLLSWEFDRLIIAHGACVSNHAKKFVERAFDWVRR